jgi:hypothetical protein
LALGSMPTAISAPLEPVTDTSIDEPAGHE